MVIAGTVAGSRQRQGGHYCPHCLRHVAPGEARRRAHREDCRSGALDVSLFHCPTCGLVLSAEVDGAPRAYAFPTPRVTT